MSTHLDMRPERAIELRKEDPKPGAQLRYEADAYEVMRPAIEQMRQRGHDVSAVSVWRNGETHTIIVQKEGA